MSSGTSTPVAGAAGTQQKTAKPSLAGVNVKQRKRVTNAAAKFEPTVFRDEFIRALSTNPNPTEDYEASLRILEGLANELDFRKYEAQLFELLIVGRLLAPGGSVLQDASEPCPLAVCSPKNGDKQVKEIVGVFGKLIRRYKYLQKPLEENAMPNILSISNRLDKPAAAGSNLSVPAGDGSGTPGTASGATTPVSGAGSSLAVPSHPRPNVDRLATFTGLMVASGQLPVTTLSTMKRDHLVKDGTALAFLLTYLKAYSSSGETFDNLTTSLRKGGNSDLLEFFPLPKRAVAELQKEFKAKGLEKVAEWYNKVVEANQKEQIMLRLRDLVAEEEEGEGRASDEEIVSYIKSASKSSSMADADLITLVWNGLMANLDARTNPTGSGTDQQVNEGTLKWIRSVNPILATFTTNARTQIALINAIQVYIYSTSTRLIPLFPKICQFLYNEDTLSSQAIFYWYEKGAKPQGKQTFLKNMEPLVKAIKESEESDEDDDE